MLHDAVIFPSSMKMFSAIDIVTKILQSNATRQFIAISTEGVSAIFYASTIETNKILLYIHFKMGKMRDAEMC